MSIRSFAQRVKVRFSKSLFFKCLLPTELDRSGDRGYNGTVGACLESSRIREIDRRVTRLTRRHEKVYEQWARVNRERIDLQRELRQLAEERDTLNQGQLIFPPIQCLTKQEHDEALRKEREEAEQWKSAEPHSTD